MTGTMPSVARDIDALVAENERLRSAAKTLGKIIDDSLMDVARATDSLDLLDEDRDGDWMLIFERLAELRPARDVAVAESNALRAENRALRDELEALQQTHVGEVMAHRDELWAERNALLQKNAALHAEVSRLGGGVR